MKIAILVEDHYQVLQAWYPYLRLQEAGIESVFVGTGQMIYKSQEQYPLKEKVSAMTITSKDFDGVIIPGGYAADILRRYPQIITFVKEMFDHGKLVAAISHGNWVLGSAGIVSEQKLIHYSDLNDEVVQATAEYFNPAIEIDKNLITARYVADLPDFCKAIIRFLKTETIPENKHLAELNFIQTNFPLFSS